MPNILVIKVTDDHLMTHFKANGDYSNLGAKVAEMMEEHHSGEVADAYALCDASLLQTAVALPKSWATGPVGGSDFRVMLKREVTTETILPPMGLTVGELIDSNPVVCHV